MMEIKSLRWILLLGAVAVLACDRDKDAAQAKTDKPQSAPAVAAADAPLPTLSLPSESGPPPAFDADRTMQYVRRCNHSSARPARCLRLRRS